MGRLFFYFGVFVATWATSWYIDFWLPENALGSLVFNGAIGVFVVWIALTHVATGSLTSISARLSTSPLPHVVLFLIGLLVAVVSAGTGVISFYFTVRLVEWIAAPNPSTSLSFSLALGLSFLVACTVVGCIVRYIDIFLQRQASGSSTWEHNGNKSGIGSTPTGGCFGKSSEPAVAR
jgi:hypothetical protein